MGVRELGNAGGNPLARARSSGGTTVAAPRGESTYAIPGTFSWTAPVGVTSVCAVCVGGGSWNAGGDGGGGGLGWKNGITVIPGTSYTVTVGDGGCAISGMNAGGDSWFVSAATVKGGGASGATGGTYTGDGGGNGGSTAGGAGGYTGNGGNGNTAGTGGGGGGGYTPTDSGAGGGGVGLHGQGANGTAGGGGGSGGSSGVAGSAGNYPGQAGNFGGGLRDASYARTGYRAGHGAVRILWGTGRAFPSTDVGTP